MSNQTTISIDKDIKKLVDMIAKSQGLSVSAVARILFSDYVKGKIEIGTRVVARDENGFTPAKAKELDQALAEAQDETDLSPPFDRGEDAIKWLKNAA